jgi:hypothetical protein
MTSLKSSIPDDPVIDVADPRGDHWLSPIL